MPGGYIGVHTGLIISAQTESELAGVLAHEISRLATPYRPPGISVEADQHGVDGGDARRLAGCEIEQPGCRRGDGRLAGRRDLRSLAFSRDFERESDRLGFEILRKSGMDTQGMADFERLQIGSALRERSATTICAHH